MVEQQEAQSQEESILSQIFKVHLTQTVEDFKKKHPGERMDDDFGFEGHEISSIHGSPDDSMVDQGEEREEMAPGEPDEDEDLVEEDEDEMRIDG